MPNFTVVSVTARPVVLTAAVGGAAAQTGWQQGNGGKRRHAG